MSPQFISLFILAISGFLFLYWLRSVCRTILSQRFERDYFADVASANRLEFPAIREALEQAGGEPDDFQQVMAQLRGDYEALTYLLRYAATLQVGRYSRMERFLVVDFHLLRLWVRLKRWLGWPSWRQDLLEMTEILQYFANVMGQRVAAFPAVVPPA
jgi:hypothetical protein